MTNSGKEKYDQIPIPEDELLDAIKKGIHKKHRLQKKKRLKSLTAAAASVIIILFTCANIPVFYTYAQEIPIVSMFVTAFHVGSGGKEMPDVDIEVTGDSGNVNIFFKHEHAAAENALSYSVTYFSSPVRMEIVFYGLKNADFHRIEEELMKIDAVADVYRITGKENDLAFSVVLEKGYNYEVMEFSNPGSLSINFFPDAYYTEDERHPDQTVYYIRSNPVPYGKKLESLVSQYCDEHPSQVKTREGKYIIVIGEFDTEKEAKEASDTLRDKYNTEYELYVGIGKVGEGPVN